MSKSWAWWCVLARGREGDDGQPCPCLRTHIHTHANMHTRKSLAATRNFVSLLLLLLFLHETLGVMPKVCAEGYRLKGFLKHCLLVDVPVSFLVSSWRNTSPEGLKPPHTSPTLDTRLLCHIDFPSWEPCATRWPCEPNLDLHPRKGASRSGPPGQPRTRTRTNQDCRSSGLGLIAS